jgi:hypothetical protein
MKKTTILLLLFGLACLQSTQAQKATNKSSDKKLNLEPYIGFTTSFAGGTYIDYQRAFQSVSDVNSKVSGSISPIMFGTVGFQARYAPFEDGQFANLQFSIGLQYQQKGFRNNFESTYTSPNNYTDITKFQESYQLNYISMPILARYGEKYFATLGFSLDFLWSGIRNQKLNRDQSGAGALGTGFSTELIEKQSLPSTEVNNSSTSFVLGGGIQFDETNALSLQVYFSGNVFNELTLSNPNNFRNTTLQLMYFKSF